MKVAFILILISTIIGTSASRRRPEESKLATENKRTRASCTSFEASLDNKGQRTVTLSFDSEFGSDTNADTGVDKSNSDSSLGDVKCSTILSPDTYKLLTGSDTPGDGNKSDNDQDDGTIQSPITCTFTSKTMIEITRVLSFSYGEKVSLLLPNICEKSQEINYPNIELDYTILSKNDGIATIRFDMKDEIEGDVHYKFALLSPNIDTDTEISKLNSVLSQIDQQKAKSTTITLDVPVKYNYELKLIANCDLFDYSRVFKIPVKSDIERNPKKLSGGAIAGIVIGSIAFVAIVALFIGALYIRWLNGGSLFPLCPDDLIEGVDFVYDEDGNIIILDKDAATAPPGFTELEDVDAGESEATTAQAQEEKEEEGNNDEKQGDNSQENEGTQKESNHESDEMDEDKDKEQNSNDNTKEEKKEETSKESTQQNDKSDETQE